MFTGPGEGLFLLLIMMAVKALVPSLFVEFGVLISQLVVIFNSAGLTALDPNNHKLIFSHAVHLAYYILYIATVYVTLTFPSKNRATRNGLLFCLCYRAVPAVLMWLGLIPGSFTVMDLIAQGLFMSVLTSDIILAKMSGRDLHPYIVIFAMLSILNNFLIMVSVALYFVGAIYEITDWMRLSVFGITRNVYVDGVYDMCHLGHFNSFKQALSYGTRLFVGVLSDEDVARYKRAPIMTMEERAAVVATSKFVHKVIAPAPFPGIPEEFIKKHRIHIVCHSPEYEGADDKYYVVPRSMGITRTMPRTEGMSTTELINRVSSYPKISKINKSE
jgi:choline-phosphate cytidylyltransferase